MNRQDRIVDWFREWRTPLRRFLQLRRTSPADVDDIAQEVFLRLLRYDRAALVEDPQAYLFKVAANVSAEWATRSNRRHPHREDWLDELEAPGRTEARLEQAETDARVRRSIEALPPRTREIVRLRFAEDRDLEGIATELSLTRRIVKRELAHAYAELRESLGGDRAADWRWARRRTDEGLP